MLSWSQFYQWSSRCQLRLKKNTHTHKNGNENWLVHCRRQLKLTCACNSLPSILSYSLPSILSPPALIFHRCHHHCHHGKPSSSPSQNDKTCIAEKNGKAGRENNKRRWEEKIWNDINVTFCKKDSLELFCRRRRHHGGLLRFGFEKWKINGLAQKMWAEQAKKREKKKGRKWGCAPK